MKVSVIIPTYDRPASLLATLRHLLASEVSGLDEVELIVVDDGSPQPVEPVVASLPVPPPFRLALLRQANSGPARARNTGFRAAGGDIVLFVDDDILVPPGLLLGHVAAHRVHPRSVIFGRCRLAEESERGRPLRRWLARHGDPGRDAAEEFVPASIVASGQLSVERESFLEPGGVYAEDLRTPAAEEFELSLRLRTRGVAVLMAPRLEAIHAAPIEIGLICRQQYTHGYGCAEAASRRPETRQLSELEAVIAASGPPRPDDRLGRRAAKLAKRVLSGRPLRRALVGLCRAGERIPLGALREALYRAAVSAHFIAGVRDGIRHFHRTGPPARSR